MAIGDCLRRDGELVYFLLLPRRRLGTRQNFSVCLILSIDFNYYMTSSVSGQDELNLAL